MAEGATGEPASLEPEQSVSDDWGPIRGLVQEPIQSWGTVGRTSLGCYHGGGWGQAEEATAAKAGGTTCSIRWETALLVSIPASLLIYYLPGSEAVGVTFSSGVEEGTGPSSSRQPFTLGSTR